eukprot:2637560-Pyramimonas_sp.AAC.1
MRSGWKTCAGEGRGERDAQGEEEHEEAGEGQDEEEGPAAASRGTSSREPEYIFQHPQSARICASAD